MTANLHEGKSGPRSQNSLQEALGAAPDDQKALDVQRALPIRIKFSLPTVRVRSAASGFGFCTRADNVPNVPTPVLYSPCFLPRAQFTLG